MPTSFTCLLLISTLIPATAAAAGPGASESQRPDLIVGGRPAEAGEFPWAAALYRRDADPVATQFCGAALVAPAWVATAAHCLSGRFAHNIAVQVGGLGLGDGSGALRNVIQAVPHPGYDPRTGDADLALLQLDRPVDLTCLGPLPPERQELAAPGVPAMAVGWGALDAAGASYPDFLQAAVLPLVSNEDCNAPAAYNGQVTARMLCAGYPDGASDACRGDSGGPLVIYPDGEGPYLAGIISWGDGCAQPQKYGVYTRVTAFGSWIENQLSHPATLALPLSAVQAGLEDGFVGLAVQSLATRPLTLRGRLLDALGFRSSPVEVQVDLAPAAQRVFLSRDLGNTGSAAVLSLEHPRQDVVLLAMAGNWSQNRLDGLVLPRRGLTEAVFPWWENTTASLSAYNPLPNTTANVRITWYTADGTATGSSLVTVPPLGSVSVDAIPGPDRPGVFRMDSDVKIIAWGFFSSRTTLEALPALEPRLRSQVYLPDLAPLDPASTGLMVYNAGPAPCRVALEVPGEEARKSPEWLLPPGGYRDQTIETWLADSLSPGFEGAARVIASTVASLPCVLAGALHLQRGDGQAGAAIPLPETASELVLPYLVDSRPAGLSTRIAVFNPGVQTAIGRLQYFRPDGHPGSSVEVNLGPGRRIAGGLRDAEWFGPAFEGPGGHLRLSFDRPVTALGFLEAADGHTVATLQWIAP